MTKPGYELRNDQAWVRNDQKTPVTMNKTRVSFFVTLVIFDVAKYTDIRTSLFPTKPITAQMQTEAVEGIYLFQIH